MEKHNIIVYATINTASSTSTSPSILVLMRPYHQYPLILSVFVSVTLMVSHNALTPHIFFTNVSVYRGETFTLSACIVGYDFGTTVGTIHARFFNFQRLEKSQYNQPVSTSKQCSSFDYTVYSKQANELLLLLTSALPAVFW